MHPDLGPPGCALSTTTCQGMKDQFNAKKSWLLTAIAQIAARDFFAFVFAVGALAGLSIQMLMIFSFGAFVWFIVINATLVRTRLDAC